MFLPQQDPLERLQRFWLFEVLEKTAEELPTLMEERRVREELVYRLRTDVGAGYRVMGDYSEAELERLMMLLSYFASAYVHATGETTASRIPDCIAKPLVEVAQRLERPPILSYASYCLHNWRRLDKEKPIELGNIALLQNFSLKNKRDEDWFILVHVDIEAKAGTAVEICKHIPNVKDSFQARVFLNAVHHSLRHMNNTLARMPEQCSPEVYFHGVRPYIFGFDKVVYEGCFDNAPQTFRGETGAQSSIVPLFLAALGVEHKDSLLTQHLRDMRNYMPKPHRELIGQTEGAEVDLRGWTLKDPSLTEIYNSCLEQLIAFRRKHLEYAVNYIEKKVSNPQGTGGTPYIPWLSQLVTETETYFIK
jgi:indoleamine 2,3-dioxygenase